MPVVVGVDLIVELGILALFAALLLLRTAWVPTFGQLLESLARAFDGASIGVHAFGQGFTIGFGFVAKLLRGIDNSALHLLGAGINATSYAAHRLWQWTAYLVEQTARVIGDTAEQTYASLVHLRRWVIPPLIAASLGPLYRQIESLAAQFKHLAANPTTIINPVTRVFDPRVRSLERDVKSLSATVAHLGAVAVPHGIAVPTPRLGWLTHGIDELRGRLERIARTLTPAGITGLVAAAVLSQLDLGWLKCRGVGRVGRHLCGLSGLLETLAGDALEALIVTDLCTFAGALGRAVHEFQPALEAFTGVENALIGCHGATLPADLRPPALSLPPRAALKLS